MLFITCPNCGPRNSSEFVWHGGASPRPDPSTVTPERWRAYLYGSDNSAGLVTERWVHSSGCRRWLIIERDNVTNEITSVAQYPKGGADV